MVPGHIGDVFACPVGAGPKRQGVLAEHAQHLAVVGGDRRDLPRAWGIQHLQFKGRAHDGECRCVALRKDLVEPGVPLADAVRARRHAHCNRARGRKAECDVCIRRDAVKRIGDLGRDERDECLNARWDLYRSIEAARDVAARRVGGDLNIVAAYVDLDRREAGVDQCRHFLTAVFFCW